MPADSEPLFNHRIRPVRHECRQAKPQQHDCNIDKERSAQYRGQRLKGNAMSLSFVHDNALAGIRVYLLQNNGLT